MFTPLSYNEYMDIQNIYICVRCEIFSGEAKKMLLQNTGTFAAECLPAFNYQSQFAG